MRHAERTGRLSDNSDVDGADLAAVLEAVASATQRPAWAFSDVEQAGVIAEAVAAAAG
jgi:hypothetical protein